MDKPIIAGLMLLALASCQAPDQAEGPGSRDVDIRQTGGKWQLFLDGQPFYIHGAGLEFGSIESLAAMGGNSFRTWRTDNGRDTGQEVLDRARQHGLVVTMGIDIAREREGSGRGVFGFDYNDADAVRAQLDAVREEVLQYRDHPAIMIWGIGNELNLGATNPAVWDAVNDISRMIHEVDPNHLTTTMLAGLSPELASDIRQRAPDLDLLSVQMYGDIVNLPRYIKEAGWDGPYMVTEWGATGHWEVPTTEWGAPVENSSSVKADLYRMRYETAIASDTLQCVGSYVFLWGQKQERTPTWYGLFLESGEKTEPVDVMHHIWRGVWPENRSPRLDSVRLGGADAGDNIRLRPGEQASIAAFVTDPEGDALRYVWEVMPESTDLGHGGDDEAVPERIPGLVEAADAAATVLTAPSDAGAYRLFLYAFDGMGSAAHANVPFYVEP